MKSKKIILLIIAFALFVSIIYLLFSFYAVSFNPAQWMDGSRFMFSIVAGFALIMFIVGLLTFADNE